MTLTHSELIERIKALKGYAPTQSYIAEILCYKTSKINNRAARNSKYSEKEIVILSKELGINIIENQASNTYADKVELKYYENPSLKVNIKNPLITSMWFDRELVENIWKKDPKNLCIIKMLGDKMNHGEYPLRPDDILIMDITETDPFISGTYVFTTNKDKYIFISRVSRLMDGSYKFMFLNPAYPDKVQTPEEAKELDLKIVGKVVKNLSLTI